MRITWTLAAALACAACGSEPELTASYRIGLRPPSAGGLEVRLELDHVDSDPLLLRSLVGHELGNIANVRATDRDGRVVPLRRMRAYRGDGALLRIDAPPSALRIEYEVLLPDGVPAGGGFEPRRTGVLDESSCALSLQSLILEPLGPLRRAELRVVPPRGWRVLRDVPATLDLAAWERWWAHVIVASSLPFEAHALVHGGELLCSSGTPPEVTSAVREIVRALGGRLGEPALPPRVILLPTVEGTPPLDLRASCTDVIVDLREIDVAGLRRLVRRLVPAWYGGSWLALHFGRDEMDWFSPGLAEWLAWRLPVDLGFTRRNWRASLESTWMSSPQIRRADLGPGAARFDGARLERRLASAVLVHALDARLSDLGGVFGLLADFTGSGLPRLGIDDRRRPILTSFLDEVRSPDSRSLAFEREWRIELSPRPPRSEDVPISRSLHLVVDHGSRGSLADCPCGLAPAGSAARRVHAVRGLRSQHPDLVHVCIGGFAPAKWSAASAGGDHELYAGFMADPHALGFDLVTVVPEDVYSLGARVIRDLAAELPLVAYGVRGLESACRRFEILDRGGLGIGYVGLSELLEPGTTYEAREESMSGVEFPTEFAELEMTLADLDSMVDLLVVGGTFGPRTLRRICDPRLGVDIVLLDASALAWLDRSLGWLNETAVAVETLGERGFTELTLFLSSEHVLVDVNAREYSLGATAHEAADIGDRVSGWNEKAFEARPRQPRASTRPTNREERPPAPARQPGVPSDPGR